MLSKNGHLVLLVIIAQVSSSLIVLKRNFEMIIYDKDVIVTKFIYLDPQIRFIVGDYDSRGYENYHKAFLRDANFKHLKFIQTQTNMFLSQCLQYSQPIIETYTYPDFNPNYQIDLSLNFSLKKLFFKIDPNLDLCLRKKCSFGLHCGSRNVSSLEFSSNGHYVCFKTFYNANFEDNHITHLTKNGGFLTFAVYLVKLNLRRNPLKYISSKAFNHLRNLRVLFLTYKFSTFINEENFAAILYFNKKLIFINCTSDLLNYDCYLWQRCDPTNEYYDAVFGTIAAKFSFLDILDILLIDDDDNQESEKTVKENWSFWDAYKLPLIMTCVIGCLLGISKWLPKRSSNL